MSGSTAQLLGFLATLAALAAIVLIPAWWRARDRARVLQLAAAALERGQPLTAEAIRALPGGRSLRSQAQRDLRRGVMLTAIGLFFALLGLCMYAIIGTFNPGASVVMGFSIGAFGALPGMIGLALIALSFLGKDELG